MLKRLTDAAASAVGLVVLSPLLAAIAVWIKIDSPGPVFFRGERIGRGARPFRMFKFRSMRVTPPGSGMQITVGGDPRITRAGAFLRAHKLDELPQLIDVLLGRMSLVGPRPEVPRYVAHYPPRLRDVVLSIRPGITDPAAVEFRDESDLLAQSADPERMYLDVILPRKLALYEQYASTRTWAGDVRIILQTLRTL